MKVTITLLQAFLLVVCLSSPTILASSTHEVEGAAGSVYSGFRGLSWVSPKEDDDAVTTKKSSSSTATDDDSTSSSSSTSTMSHSVSSTAAADDDDDSTTTTTSKTASTRSATTTTDDDSTTTKGDDDSTNGDDDSTTTTDGDDSTASSTSTSSTNSTTATSDSTAKNATKAPAVNPVVDDITNLYDDDAVVGNSTAFLPPEADQPESWPIIVTGIFLAATLILLAATCFKMYRKRSKYTPVPSIDV